MTRSLKLPLESSRPLRYFSNLKGMLLKMQKGKEMDVSIYSVRSVEVLQEQRLPSGITLLLP